MLVVNTDVFAVTLTTSNTSITAALRCTSTGSCNYLRQPDNRACFSGFSEPDRSRHERESEPARRPTVAPRATPAPRQSEPQRRHRARDGDAVRGVAGSEQVLRVAHRRGLRRRRFVQLLLLPVLTPPTTYRYKSKTGYCCFSYKWKAVTYRPGISTGILREFDKNSFG